MSKISISKPLYLKKPKAKACKIVFGIPLFPADLVCNNHKLAGEVLRKQGCVVVPCFTGDELRDIHEATKIDIMNYPEYRGDGMKAATAELKVNGLEYQITVHETKRAPKSVFTGRVGSEKQLISLQKALDRFSGKRIKHVLGAFQAHGNPSSFHCHSARTVRSRCYEQCRQLFTHTLDDPHGWNIEMNYDRVAVRQQSTKIPEDKEKWHRDVITGQYLDDGDQIFGGWINLDLKDDQRFICDLGTHLRPADSNGFVRDQPNNSANIVNIPPGHCIIFYQHILHAIAPSEFNSDSYRQFISYRLTRSKIPLWGSTEKLNTISCGTTPKTPSNQVIKVWMSNHHTSALLWSHTIVWGLVTFKEEYITKKYGKNGTIYYLPEAPMTPKSPKYPIYTYSQYEKDILMPQPLL